RSRGRAAGPEPRGAGLVGGGGRSRRPAARLPASASAANAAADDARPAPRGTRLRVETRARSTQPASWRSRSRNPTRRSRSAPLAGSPSMVSSSVDESPQPTSASTDRPSRVTEMLPVAGRLSEASRFPQYLTRATLTLERAVTGVPNISERPACILFDERTHVPAAPRQRLLGGAGPFPAAPNAAK